MSSKRRLILLYLIAPILLMGQEATMKMPDGYSSETTLKIAYFFGTLDLIETEFPVPDNVAQYKDIIYKRVDSTNLKLDIYHAKNIRPFTYPYCIVLPRQIHTRVSCIW